MAGQGLDFELEPDVIVLGRERVNLADLDEVRGAERALEHDLVHASFRRSSETTFHSSRPEFGIGVFVVRRLVVEERVGRLGEEKGIRHDSCRQDGGL